MFESHIQCSYPRPTIIIYAIWNSRPFQGSDDVPKSLLLEPKRQVFKQVRRKSSKRQVYHGRSFFHFIIFVAYMNQLIFVAYMNQQSNRTHKFIVTPEFSKCCICKLINCCFRSW